MIAESLRQALADVPRVRLGHLPTPLEPGPRLPGGAKVLIKRDDLTALGMGGNKVRKLEFLCGDALSRGADTLVTLGAAQSNHARLTAAAGAVLGIPTHLVLGGNAPDQLTGNQLLSALFGATLHFPGTDDWDRLEEHTADLSDQLTSEGRHVYRMPIGGSTVSACSGSPPVGLSFSTSAPTYQSNRPRSSMRAPPEGRMQVFSSGEQRAGRGTPRFQMSSPSASPSARTTWRPPQRRWLPRRCAGLALAWRCIRRRSLLMGAGRGKGTRCRRQRPTPLFSGRPRGRLLSWIACTPARHLLGCSARPMRDGG